MNAASGGTWCGTKRDGLAGLVDRRLGQASQRQAPVDEVLALTERYRQRHLGWNVRHFHSWYRRDGGERSYSWVKQRLQAAGLVAVGKQKGRTARSGNGWHCRG